MSPVLRMSVSKKLSLFIMLAFVACSNKEIIEKAMSAAIRMLMAPLSCVSQGQGGALVA